MKFCFNLFFIYISVILLMVLKKNNLVEGRENYNKFIDNKGLYDLLSSMSENTYLNANRKVVFFQLITKKKKKKNLNMIMGYLYEFLVSMGANCDIYNWNNQHFVIVTKMDNDIDKQAILDQFKDIISNVSEQGARDLLQNLNALDLKEL